MHEEVQVSATRWFRGVSVASPPSQSDSVLWLWAEWRVYASVNQVISYIHVRHQAIFWTIVGLVLIEFLATKIRKNGITKQ